MKSVHLTPEEAEDFWPKVAPFLQRVLDKTGDDEYDVEHILQRIKEESLALFLMIDNEGNEVGAYTMSFHDLPKLKLATIVHLGADRLEDAIACYPKMEEYARHNNAGKLNILGRKGWKPVLEALGHSSKLAIFEKAL